MELGALVCLPGGTPKCSACPWKNHCSSFEKGLTDVIPVRSRNKERRIEKRTILVIREDDRFLMRKRAKRGLLAGLSEFIVTEGHCTRREALQYVQDLGLEPLKISSLPDSKHIFSHVEWHMKAYEIRVSASEDELPGMFWADKKELQNTAVPSAFHAYLEYYDLR